MVRFIHGQTQVRSDFPSLIDLAHSNYKAFVVTHFGSAGTRITLTDALGSKECNHRVDLGTDRSTIYNGLLGAISYIAALVYEMRAKRGIINKEEGAISELIQVLEAPGVFTPKLNIGWDI